YVEGVHMPGDRTVLALGVVLVLGMMTASGMVLSGCGGGPNSFQPDVGQVDSPVPGDTGPDITLTDQPASDRPGPASDAGPGEDRPAKDGPGLDLPRGDGAPPPPISCSGTDDCPPGEECQGGNCVGRQLPDGQPCRGNAECQSGLCQGGICM